MVTRFANGKVPASALVALDTPYHWSSPKGAAMWYALRRNVLAKYKKTLHITPGKNAYRDLAGQEYARTNACAAGNCNAAALPGWSSHGGTWRDTAVTRGQWVDAMAFDIGDYGQIGEAAFFAEARAVGFLVDAIRPETSGGIREPWHIIVLDPWGAVPASLTPKEGFLMALSDAQQQAIYDAIFKGGSSMSRGLSLDKQINDIYNVVSAKVHRGGKQIAQIQDNADTNTMVRALTASVGALQASVTALAAAGGADPATIEAAAKRGAEAALAGLTLKPVVEG